uniref:Uncharacterized protein n=1 Tax=Arundo donax TaxID=35708 RepID=A0A0A9A9N0_ARUDO
MMITNPDYKNVLDDRETTGVTLQNLTFTIMSSTIAAKKNQLHENTSFLVIVEILHQ